MKDKIIQFTKMHGLGNDFVVIETLNQSVELSTEYIKALSNRKTGIGFDQLLFLSPHDRYDAQYKIYNADGSQVEQCGNGARCVAKFLWDNKLVQSEDMIVMTQTRPLPLKYINDDKIEVDMGKAELIQQAIKFSNKEDIYLGDLIHVGNPHYIIEHDLDIEELQSIGPLLQKQPHFPDGVNVTFLQHVASDRVKILTYERGVGITEACGSAATASGYYHFLKTGHREIFVEMRGGSVFIVINPNETLNMQGPARTVFQGELHANQT